jgi:hypothetical protein
MHVIVGWNDVRYSYQNTRTIEQYARETGNPKSSGLEYRDDSLYCFI